MRSLVELTVLLGVAVLIAVASSQNTGKSNGNDVPVVTAPVGGIRGSHMRTLRGKTIYAFRGIKYAQPPVGVLRFQPPVPAEDWKEVFDASKEGPACPNLGGLESDMSEDCLRLNVYTTKLPKANETVKRSVLVFVHPGGYYGDSARSSAYGPEYLLDHDLVLVTMNYRLGSLGFISTGDSLLPGNVGLKDQACALKWVKRNIEAFGGDPNSVTLSGYSAGGLSVMLHLVSPMSEKLFDRVVLMSGASLTLEPLPTHQKALAIKQAKFLDCPYDTTGAMLVCLNSKTWQEIHATYSRFFEWHGDPIMIWYPVIEQHGSSRFLTDQPLKLFKEGKFHQVPLICGVTVDEFGGVVVEFETRARRGDLSMYRDFNNRWYEIAPISFMYTRGSNESRYKSAELRKFYFGEEPIDPANSQGIAEIYADSIVKFPTHRACKVIAASSKHPVYFYEFSYAGRYSIVKWNSTDNYGVVHMDDLQYLFYSKTMFPFFNVDDPEVSMVDKYTDIMASFAQTGEPIPHNSAMFQNVTWDRYVPEQDNYLDIKSEPIMKYGLTSERMAIWDRLFPIQVITGCSNYTESKR